MFSFCETILTVNSIFFSYGKNLSWNRKKKFKRLKEILIFLRDIDYIKIIIESDFIKLNYYSLKLLSITENCTVFSIALYLSFHRIFISHITVVGAWFVNS